MQHFQQTNETVVISRDFVTFKQAHSREPETKFVCGCIMVKIRYLVSLSAETPVLVPGPQQSYCYTVNVTRVDENKVFPLHDGIGAESVTERVGNTGSN